MKPASSDRRPIHHSPIFWIGIALCLAAIAFGLTTSRGDQHRSHDEALRTIGSPSSPFGPKRTCRLAHLTSAFWARPDMANADRHFRF